MVIRGNSRSNPRQLAHYLLAKGENEHIHILDVDSKANPQNEDLHRAIFAMGISSELSRSDKGLYHAQINPAPGEDKLMNEEHWFQAADILGKQLGLENQRRVIVLHSKKGRTHAHVVWERFSHDTQKMVSDSFSRLAQDRARKEMELTFKQTPTPHRNIHRPELKAHLSELWASTKSGKEFLQAAKENGYLISEGAGRNPYMVIDEFARSHNLPRQLKGVRLKDVREKLRGEKLMSEKDAIAFARANNGNNGQKEKGKDTTGQQAHFKQAASGFAQARDEMLNKPKPDPKLDHQAKQDAFKDNAEPLLSPEPTQAEKDKAKAKETAGQFRNTKDEMLKGNAEPGKEKAVKEEFTENIKPPIDPRRAAFRKRMQEMDKDLQRDMDKGLEME